MPGGNTPFSLELEIRKRPCVFLSVWMILGILAGEYLSHVWLSAGILFLLLGGLFAVRLPKRQLLLAGVLAATGWLQHRNHTAVVPPHDLRHLLGDRPRACDVEGAIASRPQTKAADAGERFQTRFELKALRIRLQSRWQPATGRIHVTVNAPPIAGVHRGQRIRLTGTVGRPPAPLVAGQFDFRKHLRYHGIHYAMTLGDWNPKAQLLPPPVPQPLSSRFQDWARRALTIGQPREDEATRLIWAMILGWRTWLTGELREPFVQSGTFHVFAISGLHIMIVAAMMVLIAKCCGLPRHRAGWIVIPGLWFYTAATGFPTSAVRATVMACVILLGWMQRRPSETLNSIGAAALLILLWEPLQIFQPGFQLSFAVVISIVVLCQRWRNFDRKQLRDNELTPRSYQHRKSRRGLMLVRTRDNELTPRSYQHRKSRRGLMLIRTCDDELTPRNYQHPWQRFARYARRKLWSRFSVSAAAWLGSLPLIAWYFNLFTPASLLLNLILVLFSAPLVMASAWLSLATADWLPAVAALANSSAWLWMTAMIQTCRTFATLPFAYFEVPRPPLSCVFLYYLAFAALAFSPRSGAAKIIAAACAAAVLGMAGHHIMAAGKQRTTIAFLPIPEGDAISIDAPGVDADWLIDGGPEWCYPFILEPFLLNQPLSARYRNHLLTHGDKQHLSALPQLFKQNPPAQIVISPLSFRSLFYRQLIQQLRADGVLVHQRVANDRIGPWKILHPHLGASPSPADSAPLVLLGELHGLKILLLSDLDRRHQKELLNQQPDLKADFVSLGLPKDGQPPNLHVLEQLEPQVIAVTGSRNRNGERWVRHFRRHFRRQKVAILFTGVDGVVKLTLSRRVSKITTHSGKEIPLAPRP